MAEKKIKRKPTFENDPKKPKRIFWIAERMETKYITKNVCKRWTFWLCDTTYKMQQKGQ